MKEGSGLNRVSIALLYLLLNICHYFGYELYETFLVISFSAFTDSELSVRQ